MVTNNHDSSLQLDDQTYISDMEEKGTWIFHFTFFSLTFLQEFSTQHPGSNAILGHFLQTSLKLVISSNLESPVSHVARAAPQTKPHSRGPSLLYPSLFAPCCCDDPFLRYSPWNTSPSPESHIPHPPISHIFFRF